MRIKMFYHHPRGGGSSRVFALAVGDDHQIAQGDVDVQDGVLVLFAQGAVVALLGKEDHWLPWDRYLAHCLNLTYRQNPRSTAGCEIERALSYSALKELPRSCRRNTCGNWPALFLPMIALAGACELLYRLLRPPLSVLRSGQSVRLILDKKTIIPKPQILYHGSLPFG